MSPKYDETSERAAPRPGGSEIYEPFRPPTAHSDITVPLGQAAVPGLLAAVLLLLVAVGLDWQATWRQWLMLGGLPFVILTLALYFWRLGWISETIYRAETLTGTDLTGDGEVGAPHAATIGRAAARDPIQREKDLLDRFVDACYSTYPAETGSSHRALRAAGFKEAEIVRLRALLMRSDVGIAQWQGGSPKNGLKLLVPKDKAQEIVKRLVWLPNGKVWGD